MKKLPKYLDVNALLDAVDASQNLTDALAVLVTLPAEDRESIAKYLRQLCVGCVKTNEQLAAMRTAYGK